MVTTVEGTTSIFPYARISGSEQSIVPDTNPKATSVDSLYLSSDPDLLIREYFLSSPAQRVGLRSLIFQNIKSWLSTRLILLWSIRREVSEAHDGAIDLLSECEDISLLKETAVYLESASLLTVTHKVSLSRLDDFWEVLIKGTAYALKIPIQERFNLISGICSLVHQINRRVIKAALIDALVIFSDEMDADPIYMLLLPFKSSHEPDLYIREYAEDALQEIHPST